MAKTEQVHRPTKKDHFKIKFASTQAKKGWTDLNATIRNPLIEAWDILTVSPGVATARNYPLKGDLGLVTYQGKTYERRQFKPTVKGDARIWFFIDKGAMVVYLEQVHTNHPNETK